MSQKVANLKKGKIHLSIVENRTIVAINYQGDIHVLSLVHHLVPPAIVTQT